MRLRFVQVGLGRGVYRFSVYRFYATSCLRGKVKNQGGVL